MELQRTLPSSTGSTYLLLIGVVSLQIQPIPFSLAPWFDIDPDFLQLVSGDLIVLQLDWFAAGSYMCAGVQDLSISIFLVASVFRS